MNLFQKINEVRKTVDYVQKDKSVSTGGGSYKAVSHDLITAMVRGPMVTHGIVSYPVLVASTMNLPVVGTDGTTAKQRLYESTYDFHFVNCDDPKDEIVLRIEAHAMDNADKAPGKALSYAKKYAILKLFELETGEDEESRYNKDEFDVQPWLVKIAESPDLDALKAVYAQAVSAANGDKLSVKTIVKAKDVRKEALSQVTA